MFPMLLHGACIVLPRAASHSSQISYSISCFSGVLSPTALWTATATAHWMPWLLVAGGKLPLLYSIRSLTSLVAVWANPKRLEHPEGSREAAKNAPIPPPLSHLFLVGPIVRHPAIQTPKVPRPAAEPLQHFLFLLHLLQYGPIPIHLRASRATPQ